MTTPPGPLVPPVPVVPVVPLVTPLAPQSVPPNPEWRLWHTLASLAIVAAIFALAIWAAMSKTLVKDVHGRVPVWTFLALIVLLAAFAILMGWGITGYVAGALMDPMKGSRLSLSRLQLLAWTFLVLAAYLDAFIVNISAGRASPLAVKIPGELLIAMGISVSSLVGAKIVLAVKQDQNGALGPGADVTHDLRSAVYKAPVPQWRDVFQGDTAQAAGSLDLGKIQMFYITIALILGYGIAVASGFAHAQSGIGSLPRLDQAFVALLAISHAGYLTTKAAS